MWEIKTVKDLKEFLNTVPEEHFVWFQNDDGVSMAWEGNVEIQMLDDDATLMNAQYVEEYNKETVDSKPVEQIEYKENCVVFDLQYR